MLHVRMCMCMLHVACGFSRVRTALQVLSYQCFDRRAVLLPHPRLSALLTELKVLAAPWVRHRVRVYQLGIPDTVEYFARTNTPLLWSRKAKPQRPTAFRWAPDTFAGRP